MPIDPKKIAEWQRLVDEVMPLGGMVIGAGARAERAAVGLLGATIALLAEREELLALLREVERNCTATDGYAICPICSPEFSPSPEPPDHKPDCRLAALLGK